MACSACAGHSPRIAPAPGIVGVAGLVAAARFIGGVRGGVDRLHSPRVAPAEPHIQHRLHNNIWQQCSSWCCTAALPQPALHCTAQNGLAGNCSGEGQHLTCSSPHPHPRPLPLPSTPQSAAHLEAVRGVVYCKHAVHHSAHIHSGPVLRRPAPGPRGRRACKQQACCATAGGPVTAGLWCNNRQSGGLRPRETKQDLHSRALALQGAGHLAVGECAEQAHAHQRRHGRPIARHAAQDLADTRARVLCVRAALDRADRVLH